MKKTFKKSIVVLFSLAVCMMAMAMPTVSANADVAITFETQAMENSSDGLLVSNLYATTTANEGSVEGYHIKGGIIKFNFSEAMDVSTLTPENIKITLGASTYLAHNPKFNSSTSEWTYTPYEVTATSYSISISDMCEGTQTHTVTFTSGVKTAGGEAITPVEKKFKTGRITTTANVGGRQLMDVAYKKTVTFHESNGTEVHYEDRDGALLVDYSGSYASSGGTECTLPGDGRWSDTNTKNRYTKIDLGNYYNIYDVILYETGWVQPSYVNCPLDIYYTNDPDATYESESATKVGALANNPEFNSTTGAEGSAGGRGHSRYLSPAAPFRARYIIIKNQFAYGEKTQQIRVIAEVDADFGKMTAEKNGSTVTKFNGTGTYVVTCPVKETKSDAGTSYMIVAGYDENGIVTKLNCAKVKVSDDQVSLATTIDNANTKSLKAILIKSFSEPQMLTDALILDAQ